MKDITVLITAAGSLFAPEFVRCLKENNERTIRVVGVDCNSDATIMEYCDSVYCVPLASSLSYTDCLLTICEHEKVDILIPFMSAELIPLQNKELEFEKIGTTLSISNRNSIQTCIDKYKLYESMKKAGIKTPKYTKFNSVHGFKDAVASIGYPKVPVCVKALTLSGSRGMRIIDPNKSRMDILFGEKPNSVYTSYDDLLSIFESEPELMPDMMAMEYLSGEEFSVDVLADHGKIVYMCARLSKTIVASIPMESMLFEEPKAYAICEQVISMLDYDGNADFDFRYNADGEPVLMEVNPRIAATMAIFKEGGLNLPYLRIKHLLGEPLPPITPQYGLTMKRRYKEYYS